MIFHRARQTPAPVPAFDLAIAEYKQSLTNFKSNVPSGSPDSVVSAYIAIGMPPYLWDFKPDGYKLVGGRIDHMPDGTPVIYTLYRGYVGALMCMFKQTHKFNPPPGVYEEHHHYLFYKYKGYSICLTDLSGFNYGTSNYICVLAARVPIKEFVQEVLSAVP
jgi:hypothetical protein